MFMKGRTAVLRIDPQLNTIYVKLTNAAEDAFFSYKNVNDLAEYFTALSVMFSLVGHYINPMFKPFDDNTAIYMYDIDAKVMRCINGGESIVAIDDCLRVNPADMNRWIPYPPEVME